MAETKQRAKHDEWSPGVWYCHGHGAGFEADEARRNGGNCPWCGGGVAGLDN